MSADTIARLKITLNDVEPAVLRRIEVPFDIRLDRLHLVIQAAMGWTNTHLYEIRARDVGWGIPDRDWADGPLDARKARLGDVLEDVGVKNPKHERHAEFKEWLADDFDPNIAPEWLAGEVTGLAKRWSRKPTAKRQRSA